MKKYNKLLAYSICFCSLPLQQNLFASPDPIAALKQIRNETGNPIKVFPGPYATINSKTVWEKMSNPPNTTLKYISVGNADNIWAIGNNQKIYQWMGSRTGNYWLEMDGRAVQVSVGGDGQAWVVNIAGDMWKREVNGKWHKFPGKAVQIAIGHNGREWCVNSAGTIFRWNNKNGKWAPQSGKATHISVGDDGEVWHIAGNDLFRWDGNKWIRMPGALKQISVGNSKNIWGVNKKNQVFKWQNNKWTQFPGAFKQVSVGNDGEVWGINSNNIPCKISHKKEFTIAPGATLTASQQIIPKPVKIYGGMYGHNHGGSDRYPVLLQVQRMVNPKGLYISGDKDHYFPDPKKGGTNYLVLYYSINNGPIQIGVFDEYKTTHIKGKVKVYSAYYGLGGSWKGCSSGEITEILQKHVKNGKLSVPGQGQKGARDRIFNKRYKHTQYLRFYYQLGDDPITFVQRHERADISIAPKPSLTVFPVTATKKTTVKGTINKTIPNFSKSTILKLDPLYNNGIAWLDQAIENPNKTTVTFRAQANNDIHVNFANREDFQKNNHTWQIVIGGANNTKSIIRKHKKDVATVNVKQNPNAAVSEGRYELYWISIDNGFIMVGKGFPGENIMMYWKDPNPPNRVNRIGFSSWNKPIKYAEVQTLPPIVPQSPTDSYFKFEKSVKKLETPMRLNDLGGIAFQIAPKDKDSINISFKQTSKTDTYQFVLTSENISLNRQGKTILTTATPANIKYNGQTRKYWASLNNGFLTLGYGNAGTNPLLIWKDPNTIKEIQTTEIKTKNNVADFNNIEIIPPICINFEKKKEGYKKENTIFQYKGSVTIRYPFLYEIFQTGPTVNVKDIIYHEQKSLVGMKEPGATYQYLLVIKKDGTPELKQLQTRTESPLKVEWRTKARVDVISANEKESIASAKQQMSNSLIQAGGAIGGMGGGNPWTAGAAAAAGGYMVKKGLDKAKEAYGARLKAANLKKQAALLDLQREEMFKELGFVLTEKWAGRKVGETAIPPEAIKNKEKVEIALKEIRDKKYSPFILKHFSILIDKYNYIVNRIIHPYVISDKATKNEIFKGIGNLVNAINKYNELKEKPLNDYKNLLTLLINIHDNYYIYAQENKADESYKLKFYFGLSKIFYPIFEEYNSTTLGFNIAPFHGEYVWLKDQFEIPEKGSIHFEAQGIAEMVIGLAQKPGKTRNTGKEFYEVAIGKWDNTASDISLKIHDQTYTTKEILEKDNEQAVATPIDFKKYWISINNGKISLGINEFKPANKLIEWKDPYPIKSIKRVGLSSGNYDITYRGVILGPPLEEWKTMTIAEISEAGTLSSEKFKQLTIELTNKLSKLKKKDAKEWLSNFTSITNNMIGQPKEELKLFNKLVNRIKFYNKKLSKNMNTIFGKNKKKLDNLLEQASISMQKIIESTTIEIKSIQLKTADFWIKKFFHIINNISKDPQELHALVKLTNEIDEYIKNLPNWTLDRFGEKNIKTLKNELIPKAKELTKNFEDQKIETKTPTVKLRKIEREAKEDEKIRTGEEEEYEEEDDEEEYEEDDDEDSEDEDDEEYEEDDDEDSEDEDNEEYEDDDEEDKESYEEDDDE